MKKNIKSLLIIFAIICCIALLNLDVVLQASTYSTITGAKLFHDQATYFLSNSEPEAGENLTIRLRAEKGLLSSASVEWCTESEETFSVEAMTKLTESFDKTGDYEYWEATVTVPDSMFYYRFQVKNTLYTRYYYSYTGSDSYNSVSTDAMDSTYCWKLLPGFFTPDWAKGVTYYSIMPDAFYNGDPTNDDHNSDRNYDQPWNLTHNGLSDRYGGDLQGMMDKIDYIKSLGVNAVCYNPITSVAQNGGYGTYNQNQIESTLGNGQKYSEFIDLMHDNGLKLVQDVAIYHTVRDSIYYNESGRWPLLGYAQGEESPYYDMISNPLVEAWGGVVLNNASEDAKQELWANEDAPLAKYVNASLGYGVDGYRFDCGGTITGTDANGNKVGTSAIISEMREYIKSINPEALLISEASANEQLNSGAWDGQWQLNVGNHLRSTADNGDLFYIRNILEQSKHEILRGVTLCSHTQINTHDYYGVTYEEENEDFVNAVKLMQMTTLGSPSVYYGEETNFSGRTFSSAEGQAEGFSSFNWDESTWDYEVLNYHKALIELRNSYTSLKDGAIYELVRPTTTSNQFYAYGRFDENGAVVTYVNTSGSLATKTVDVSLLGVADGEVMTDWFTGKQYTVSGGSVTMDVPAGGTVLVTGDKKASYVEGYSVDTIDSMEFVNAPAFHNYSYSAYIECDENSEIAVMARNSLDKDSMYYAVTIKGTTATVTARKIYAADPVVVTTADIGNAKYIKIARNSDNQFVVYLGTGSDTSVDYAILSGSECALSMDYRNYVGVSVLNGTPSFEQMKIENSGRALSDDFNGDVTSSMLSGVDDAKGTLSSGKLTLPANNAVTTKSFDNDWTLKANIEYTPTQNNDYAGVICKQDEKSFVVAGRIKLADEQKLFFAKSSNGELVIESLADDVKPSSDVIVQLQRIGSAYTAVYSYDGNQWYAIGDSIFFNLSDENPGIAVSGTVSAAFDYVSFGDAIHDGASYHAPRTPGKEVNLSVGKYNGTFSLQAVSGTWEHASEGFYQTDAGVSQLSIKNKVYDSFRAEATFCLKEGASWAGMNFGKTSFDSTASEGYLLKYTSGDKLVLEKDGKQIESYTCNLEDDFVRVVLEVDEEKIKVYVGQNATPVMSIDNAGDTFGYFSYCADGPAHVNNYNVGTINSPIYSADTARVFDDRLVLYYKNSSTKQLTAYLREYAYTDFMMSTTMSMHIGDESADASAGILLNGFVGATAGESVYLQYSSDGTLHLIEDGEELCTAYTVPNAPTTIGLMIVKQNGEYAIYVNNGTTPVMEYSEGISRGGVIAFASQNATTSFTDLQIHEISTVEDYTNDVIYNNWIDRYVEETSSFTDDFSTSKLISEDYYAYRGNWAISDGTLKTMTHTDIGAGVTYVGSEYSDFELSFKMKRSSSEANPGFAGVSFRKLSPQDSYDESGVTLAFYTHTLTLIKENNADVATSYENNTTSYAFTPDVWHNIKVICKGDSFQVYSDGTLIFEGTDNEYAGGYITFRSGKTPVEFDDIEIVPIQANEKNWASELSLVATQSVYDLLDETSEGFTMEKGDAYVFEMDIRQTVDTSGNGQLNQNMFAFDLLKQSDATAKPAGIAFSDNRVLYWNVGGEQSVNVNHDKWYLPLKTNTTYHYIFTVNAYESIQVQVLEADGETVKYEGMVPWSRIYGLNGCTENSDTVFIPNLIFTNQVGTVSNIRVTYIDTQMLNVKAQSRVNPKNSANTDVRFVSSVNNAEDYSEAGFVFSLKNATPVMNGSNCATRSIKTVYEKIYAGGTLIGIDKAGYTDYSKYMFVYGLGNFTTDMQIYVRAYVKLENSNAIVYGDVVKITIDGANVISKTVISNNHGGLWTETTEPNPEYEGVEDLFG